MKTLDNLSVGAAPVVTADYFEFLSFRSVIPVLIAFAVLNAQAAVRYVDVNSANPSPPYADWSTAAKTIQAAVDAADPADEIWVTNGIYGSGGTVVAAVSGTNRVAVTKPVKLLSVNGPEFTIIEGFYGATNYSGHLRSIRCVYLTYGAILSGFTVTKGAAAMYGGGVACETNAVLTNCVIRDNQGSYGGGVRQGILYNCVLSNNWVHHGGAGAFGSTLINCTVVSNAANAYPLGISGQGTGGGADSSTLSNCRVIGNTAARWGGGAFQSTLNACVVMSNSMPAWYTVTSDGGGIANSSANNSLIACNTAPSRGGGAFQSQLTNCTVAANTAGSGGGVNGGNMDNSIVYFNSATNGPNYIDGTFNYCCTTPMPTNGMANLDADPLFADLAKANLRLQPSSPCINAGRNEDALLPTDLDGNPRIAGGTVDLGAYELPSTIQILSLAKSDSGVRLEWKSVAGQTYFIERSTNLAAQPCFFPLVSDLTGQPGTTSYIDSDTSGAQRCFYRIGVK